MTALPEPRFRVKLAGPSFPSLDLAAVAELLGSGWLTNGARVREFEQEFARFQDAPHAVAVSSCTAALHLALLGHGIGPGDEVITSALTFAATCNVILQAGATPVPVDVDPRTLTLDPSLLAAAITPRTRAIVPVHFAGLLADPAPLLQACDRHGLALIHDAAHATEARHAGRRPGGLRDTACFSFYATKNLPIGEGGMLTTHDDAVAAQARVLRSHGMSADAFARDAAEADAARWRHWDMQRPGFNYKMTELAALLGSAQLPHVEGWRVRREALAARYRAGLAGIDGLRLCAGAADATHAHHIFVIRIERAGVERDLLLPRLRARGIEAAVHYRAISDLTWYRRRFGWTDADFPVATEAGRSCITLPLHPQMTDDDADLVMATLRDLLGG